MVKLALIALGGALGALARHTISDLTYRVTGSGFPWGTLAVNLSGCLVIGFLWAAAERAPLPGHGSSLVFVGFLGAYTTFSTFGIETLNLLRNGDTVLALANVAASNLGGLVIVWVGFVIGRHLLS